MVYDKATSVLSTTVDAPAWLHKFVIGRKGANIKKVTQDLSKGFHVEFTENQIRIEGPREEVEKVQAEMEKMVKELLTTHTFEELTVDPKYYKHIIGKGGATGAFLMRLIFICGTYETRALEIYNLPTFCFQLIV